MTKQLKTKKKDNVDLWEVINVEFNLIESCDTIRGALTHFKRLFEKIQIIPQVNQALFQVENQIAKEDHIVFENRQNGIGWFRSKLKQCLAFLPQGGLLLYDINALLKFEILSLGEQEYLRTLLFNLSHVASEVVNNKESHALFEGWAQIDQLSSGEFGILKFIFPDYVECEIKKPSMEEEMQLWKEKSDISLATLFRFLKILSLYDSFSYLKLDVDPSSFTPPKNLLELAYRENQARIGLFLSLFDSQDVNRHPLTVDELKKLVKRFVFMLQQEVSIPAIKGPALKSEMSAAAEAYCISELVDYVRNLPPEDLKGLRKKKYGVEIFEQLFQKAKESNKVFAGSITPTLVKERAGPTANRTLFEKYGIIWRPLINQK